MSSITGITNLVHPLCILAIARVFTWYSRIIFNERLRTYISITDSLIFERHSVEWIEETILS